MSADDALRSSPSADVYGRDASRVMLAAPIGEADLG